MGDKPQSEKFRAFRLTMRFVVCALCLMLSAHPAATQVVANPISGCSGNTALFNPAQGQDIVVPVEFTVSVFAKGLNFPTGIAFLSQGNGFEVYVLESGHGLPSRCNDQSQFGSGDFDPRNPFTPDIPYDWRIKHG